MKRNEMRITPAALGAALSGNLDNFLVAATPGGIEAQEKAGQTTFVQSATLPKDMRRNTREQFEAIGFTFGPDADDIFVNVRMPDGWKKVATNHSMWSDLVDDKGRKRAGIFYKAAFYDRNAHISLNRRYTVDCYESCDADGNPAEYPSSHSKVVVKDGDAELYRVGIYLERDYQALDVLEKQALAWLSEHFPLHDDPTAYWD